VRVAVACREVSCFPRITDSLEGDIQCSSGCLANDGENAGRAT
jgi:hypothetical protein